MVPLRMGRIVWAVVPDKRGQNPKRRPIVLLTPPDRVPAGQPLIGIAITTRLEEPLPDDYVLLPWNRQKQGSSRLPERCAAVCDWPVTFPEQAIQEVGGLIYGELLGDIVARSAAHVQRLLQSLASPPTAPPADPPPSPQPPTPG